MGEAERLSKGEGAGEAMRVVGALTGSKLVSSPSSRPEIRRLVLGLRVDALEWVELARTLLALMSDTWPEWVVGMHPAGEDTHALSPAASVKRAWQVSVGACENAEGASVSGGE